MLICGAPIRLFYNPEGSACDRYSNTSNKTVCSAAIIMNSEKVWHQRGPRLWDLPWQITPAAGGEAPLLGCRDFPDVSWPFSASARLSYIPAKRPSLLLCRIQNRDFQVLQGKRKKKGCINACDSLVTSIIGLYHHTDQDHSVNEFRKPLTMHYYLVPQERSAKSQSKKRADSSPNPMFAHYVAFCVTLIWWNLEEDIHVSSPSYICHNPVCQTVCKNGSGKKLSRDGEVCGHL